MLVHSCRRQVNLIALSKKGTRYIASCSILLGAAVQADCPVGRETFTSCQIEGRNAEVLVYYDDQVVTYRYGPIGGSGKPCYVVIALMQQPPSLEQRTDRQLTLTRTFTRQRL